MHKNTKAYEVVFSGGDTKTIMASEVVETDVRVKFLGHVEGHPNYGDAHDVIESFLQQAVESYRLVPVPEENATAQGRDVFRINFKDGGHKDVRGDYVTFTTGGENKPGRYVVATAQKNSGNGRTEFMVPDDKVDSIERVTDTVGADVPVQSNARAKG
jgi:hypothetical protein